MRTRLEGRVISLEQVRAARCGKGRSDREGFSLAWLAQMTTGNNLTEDERQDAERRAAALLEYLDNGGSGDEAA